MWTDLYRLFKKLRSAFKEEDLEPWTSCEFDFTRDGKLNVSFDYIDWVNSEFGPMGEKIITCIKSLEFGLKKNMQ